MAWQSFFGFAPCPLSIAFELSAGDAMECTVASWLLPVATDAFGTVCT